MVKNSMDMALEDIIKQTKPVRGNRRGGARRGAAGGAGQRTGRAGAAGRFPGARSLLTSRNVPDGRWIHDRFDGYENGGGGGGASFGLRSAGAAVNATTKLLISNLEFGVSDNDINELFGEFGPVRRAAVHYDKSGRSLGSADVVYERRADAVRAVKQYNGVPLDGRPMKIQIVGATVASSGANSQPSFTNNRTRSAPRNRGFGGAQRGGGNRGRGQGRGGARRQQQVKSPLTQEQLDADLDAYINKME